MSRFSLRLPARLAPLWMARSGREKGLLILALVGVMAYAGHAALTHLPAGGEPFTVARPDPSLLRLPPIEAVSVEHWRSAAVEHGLALTRIETHDDSVVTRGEAASPAAFSEFARWAAQRGWWAVAWQLERRDGRSLALEARWRSQLERPGSGPESGPGSGPESEPGPGPESEPGSGPESGPGSGPESGPGSGPESEPGSGPESEPGSGPESEPGSGPESGPGPGKAALDTTATGSP